MKIKLDPWQEEVLEYEGDFLLCTGRRVGKTYIMARKAIDRMRKKKGTKILMFSLTEEQAMLIMIMAKNYLLEVEPNCIVKKQTETNKKTLTLKNFSTAFLISPLVDLLSTSKTYFCFPACIAAFSVITGLFRTSLNFIFSLNIYF